VNLNRVIAALLRMQLHNEGGKCVKVVIDGKWYTVDAVTSGPDNVVFTAKKD